MDRGCWLVEAGVVRGRAMTFGPSVKTDLRTAGANWVDQEVAVDEGIVTSRKPGDIPMFNRKMVAEFQVRSYMREPVGAHHHPDGH